MTYHLKEHKNSLTDGQTSAKIIFKKSSLEVSTRMNLKLDLWEFFINFSLFQLIEDLIWVLQHYEIIFGKRWNLCFAPFFLITRLVCLWPFSFSCIKDPLGSQFISTWIPFLKQLYKNAFKTWINRLKLCVYQN